MGRSENTWLVKCGGVILGPFSREQVGAMLRGREIGFLDEVASPLRRWQTLQVHPEFKDIVESARQAVLSEATEVSLTNTPGLTQTMSMTGGMTEEISHDVDGFTPTQREIVVDQVSEQVTVSAPAGGRFQARGMPQTLVQKKVDATIRWFWLAAAVILVAVGFVVMRQRLENGPKPALSAEQLKKQVEEALEVGAPQEALKLLRASDQGQSGDLTFYYGTLLIQEEGQTLLGRRLISPFAAEGRPEAKRALTSLAIADLLDGQLESAERNLNRALAIDPDFEPALINKSYLLLVRRQYSEARQIAQRLISAGSVNGVSYLVLAEATEGLYASTKNLAILSEASRTLRGYQKNYRAFSSEIGIHSLYIESLTKEGVKADQMREYLDQDPAFTENHRHNSFVYRASANWTQLLKLCQTVAARFQESALINTLNAACRERAGQLKEAQAFIEKAVSQEPADPLVQAWSSIILRANGRADEASVVLGRAGEANRKGAFGLPLLLQARFCQQNGDWECAREYWQKLYEAKAGDINAMAGLAAVRAHQKLFPDARKTVVMGLKFAPDFIPLLKLNLQAQKENW